MQFELSNLEIGIAYKQIVKVCVARHPFTNASGVISWTALGQMAETVKQNRVREEGTAWEGE